MLLEQAVDERDLIGDRLEQRAAVAAPVQAQTGVGFATLEHEQQARLAGEVHHDRVLCQAVHEQRAAAEVRGVQQSTLQQCVAVAVAAAARIDAEAQLRRPLGGVERKMREADELERVVVNGERAVALEVDALDVDTDRLVADRVAEAQPPVFLRQLLQVADDVLAVARVQPLHRDCVCHRLSGSKYWAADRDARTPA